MTRSRLPLECRGNAAEHRDRDDDQEGEEGELGRVSERRPEEVTDGPVERVRVAEIALKDAADPVSVLDDDRPVRAELLVELVDRLLSRERAEDRATDVAGEKLRRGEENHAEEEQRDERQPESPEEESCDRRLLQGGADCFGAPGP